MFNKNAIVRLWTRSLQKKRIAIANVYLHMKRSELSRTVAFPAENAGFRDVYVQFVGFLQAKYGIIIYFLRPSEKKALHVSVACPISKNANFINQESFKLKVAKGVKKCKLPYAPLPENDVRVGLSDPFRSDKWGTRRTDISCEWWIPLSAPIGKLLMTSYLNDLSTQDFEILSHFSPTLSSFILSLYVTVRTPAHLSRFVSGAYAEHFWRNDTANSAYSLNFNSRFYEDYEK